MDNKNQKIERFKRVAGSRVDKILQDIRSLSKCSHKNNYEYNEQDVSKMLKAIKDELRMMETLYKRSLNDKSNKFKF